ncbi:MAG: carboxypeptidase-like regulatory domain-containing protein [Planctomycetota bacterium]|nr:carboxypeptidase-like regulatory domain-containing protein [Planctomycetota bacterium]
MSPPLRRTLWSALTTVVLLALAVALLLETGQDGGGGRETPRRPERGVERDEGRHRPEKGTEGETTGVLASRGRRRDRRPGSPPTATPDARPAAALVLRVVTAPEDRPLGEEPVRLSLTGAEGTTTRSLGTDPDGRVELRGVEPGLYALELGHPRFLPYGRALRVDPPEDPPRTVTVRLEAGLTLRGLVVDEEGEPLPRARIELARAPGGGPEQRGAASGADGRFEIRALGEGEWTLTAFKNGHRGGGPRRVVLPRELPDEFPQQAPFRIELPRDRPVPLRVLTADGRPLEGAEVRVRLAGFTRAALPLGRARSDGRGIARLRGLPAEEDVELIVAGHHADYPPRQVTTTSGALLHGDVELVFSAPGRLRGRVVDAEGAGVSSGRVQLTGPVERSVLSLSSGEFLFRGLPAGAYTLRATSPSRGTSELVSLEVPSGAEVRRELRLRRGSGVVAGRVVDPDGRGLALVPVTLEARGEVLIKVTDETGGFQFDGLSAAAYRLVAGRSRRGLMVRERVRVGTRDLELTIEPPGSVLGVIDAQGSVAGYTVELRRGEEGTASVVRSHRFTASRPYFQLRDVPPGTYRVVLLRQGRVAATAKRVEVLPGERSGPVLLSPEA